MSIERTKLLLSHETEELDALVSCRHLVQRSCLRTVARNHEVDLRGLFPCLDERCCRLNRLEPADEQEVGPRMRAPFIRASRKVDKRRQMRHRSGKAAPGV